MIKTHTHTTCTFIMIMIIIIIITISFIVVNIILSSIIVFFILFYSSIKSFFRFASMRALSERMVKPPPEPKPSTTPSAPLNSPPLCSLVRTTTECAPASVAALHVELLAPTKMTSKSTSKPLCSPPADGGFRQRRPSRSRKHARVDDDVAVKVLSLQVSADFRCH